MTDFYLFFTYKTICGCKQLQYTQKLELTKKLLNTVTILHKYLKNGNSQGDNNIFCKNPLRLPTVFANLKMKQLLFTKTIYLRILKFRFGFVRDNYVGHFVKMNFKDKT